MAGSGHKSAASALHHVRRLAVYGVLCFAILFFLSWQSQNTLSVSLDSASREGEILTGLENVKAMARSLRVEVLEAKTNNPNDKTAAKRPVENFLRRVHALNGLANSCSVDIHGIESESFALVSDMRTHPPGEAAEGPTTELFHFLQVASATDQFLHTRFNEAATRRNADQGVLTACLLVVCLVGGFGMLGVIYLAVVPALNRAQEADQELQFVHDELTGAYHELESKKNDLEAEGAKLQAALDDMELQMSLHGHAARRFQSLFDGLPVGCFTCDTTGTVFEMNPKMGDLIGTANHLCLLRPAGGLFGQDDRTQDMAVIIGRLIETGSIEEDQWVVRPNGGVERLLQMHFLPLRDHNGIVVGVICCAVDLSERHKAEQALGQSQSRMRTLLEHAPTSIALFDCDMCLQVATNQWLEENNLIGQDLAGKNVFELVPELTDLWQDAVTEALTGMAVWVEDDLLLRPDGKVQWLNWELRPSFDSDGLVKGLVAFVEDMTSRREIEQRVRDSEERFDLAVRGLSVGIFDWNLTSNQMFWSQRMEQILGVDHRQDFHSHNDFFSLVHPDDQTGLAEQLDDHLAHSQPFSTEVRVMHASGHYIWLHIRGQAVWSTGGRATRMVGSVDDVSIRKAYELRVLESETRFRDVVDAAGEYIWECDADLRYTYLSDRFTATTGLSRDEAIGSKVSDIFDAEECERAERLLQSMLERSMRFANVVLKSVHRNGTEVWQRISAVPILNAEGNAVGFRGAGLDVTDQRKSEDALIEANNKVRQLVESIRDCFISLDEQHHFTYVNHAAEEELGAAMRGALLGCSLWEVFPECMHETMREALATATAGVTNVFPALNTKTGQWYEFRVNPTATGLSIFFVDVTAKKEAEDLIDQQMAQINDANFQLAMQQAELQDANVKLEKMAFTDALTGIANRKSMQEFLDNSYLHALERGVPMSVIMMDVDHFKKYNDTFGHLEGDEVLKTVASIISDTLGGRGLCARYGGEEFVIILMEEESLNAAGIAEEVRFAIENESWPLREITMSIGVANLSDSHATPAQLLNMADEALYVSKQGGRNRVTIASIEPKAA